VLWKQGGIYTDIDFLNIKSYEHLLSYGTDLNYDFDGEQWFNNAFLLFKVKSSPYLWYMMERFAQRYKPSDWGFNGPHLIVTAVKEMCDLNDTFQYVSSMKQTTRLVSPGQKCDDIFVFPESFLSSIDHNDTKLKDFFTINVTEDDLWQKELIQQAYAIHLYNAKSKNFKTNVNHSSLYIQIAKQMCPRNFQYVSNHNIEF
jgi:hypothetical protein